MRWLPAWLGKWPGQWLLVALVALPWLNPFAPGPSAFVLPWLVALLCTGALLLVHALGALAASGRSAELRISANLRPVTLFLIASCAVLAAASWRLDWINGVESAATGVALVALWACAWVGANPPHSGPQAEPIDRAVWVGLLARIWLAVALASCAMALCQYFYTEGLFAPWISPSGDGTAFANLRQRNQFASLTGIGLAALLYLLQTRPRAMAPVQTVAALVLLAAGNAASTSRTGALQWLLVALLAWWWQRGGQRGGQPVPLKRWAGLAIGIYAVASIAIPWLGSAVGNLSGSVYSRIAGPAEGGSRTWLYSNVLDLIGQRPWAGWGWRELAYAHYARDFAERFGLILDNAHNLPLHLAVELGLPVAGVFCGWIAWGLWRAWPGCAQSPQRQLATTVLLLIGLHSLTEYPLWYGPFLMTTGLCLGLLAGPQHAMKTYQPKRQFAGVSIALLAIVLIVISGLAGWDYWRASQMYLAPTERAARYQDETLARTSGVWIFKRQQRFAELVTTPITLQSAPRVLGLAADLVHYSPEPRVIQALIESATLLHFDDVAVFHLARFKLAFPAEYAAWHASWQPVAP